MEISMKIDTTNKPKNDETQTIIYIIILIIAIIYIIKYWSVPVYVSPIHYNAYANTITRLP